MGKGRVNGGGWDIVLEVYEFEVGYGRENDVVYWFEVSDIVDVYIV